MGGLTAKPFLSTYLATKLRCLGLTHRCFRSSGSFKEHLSPISRGNLRCEEPILTYRDIMTVLSQRRVYERFILRFERHPDILFPDILPLRFRSISLKRFNRNKERLIFLKSLAIT